MKPTATEHPFPSQRSVPCPPPAALRRTPAAAWRPAAPNGARHLRGQSSTVHGLGRSVGYCTEPRPVLSINWPGRGRVTSVSLSELSKSSPRPSRQAPPRPLPRAPTGRSAGARANHGRRAPPPERARRASSRRSNGTDSAPRSAARSPHPHAGKSSSPSGPGSTASPPGHRPAAAATSKGCPCAALCRPPGCSSG